MTIADEENGLQNPVKKFISFKKDKVDGKTKFVYWDKSKEQNVEVPLPIEFVAIDELKTVKGFHAPSESGIYSNEVHDLRFEELTVKAFKGGELGKGLWSDIKGAVKEQGAKFGVSVYSLMDGELVNFQFVGASLASWIGKEEKGLKFRVSKLGEDKKGSVEYKFPIFETMPITKEEKEEPTRIYKEILKPYFEECMKKQGVEGELTTNTMAFEKKGDPKDYKEEQPEFDRNPDNGAPVEVENNSGISQEQIDETKNKAEEDLRDVPF